VFHKFDLQTFVHYAGALLVV